MRKGQNLRRALLALALVAAAVAAQARSSWKIDPSQTHVLFWVDAIGWPRTAGEFKTFDGRIDIDFDRPSRSRADFRVAAKSVDVNSETMDDYLRSEVFFNEARFPDMRFVSTSVEKRDEQHARVTGDLTMLGMALAGSDLSEDIIMREFFAVEVVPENDPRLAVLVLDYFDSLLAEKHVGISQPSACAAMAPPMIIATAMAMVVFMFAS